MSQNALNINTFAARVRQLLQKVADLKKENNELYAMVDEREKEIASLKDQLNSKSKEYDALFTAKMLNVTDADMEQTKRRINRMMRTVTQCITLLSEKQ